MKKLLTLCVLSVMALTGCAAAPQAGDTQTKFQHTSTYDVRTTASMNTETLMSVDTFLKMKVDNPDFNLNESCESYQNVLTKTAKRSWAMRGYTVTFTTTVQLNNGNTYTCERFTLNL